MSGKILVVGDCCTDAYDLTSGLGAFQALIAKDVNEAVQHIKVDNKIHFTIVCRNCFGAEAYDIAKTLDLAMQDRVIPTMVLDDQKELNSALKNAHPYSNSILAAILGQASIGIAIGFEPESLSNKQEGLPIFNDAFLKIAGRSRDELISLGWRQITYARDLPLDLDKYRLILKDELRGYTAEKRLVRPDGSLIWVELTVSPIQLPNSERRSSICLIKDISDRKEIEKRLSESERSKAVLLENLPGLAYRCLNDRFWTMQFVSEGCLRLTGYSAESLLNNRDLSFNDLIVPEYQALVWQKWQDALTYARHFELEYEIITATGKRKWVLEMGQGVFDSEGNVEALEGIIIDITDRKHNELQLKLVSEVDLITGLPNRRALENAIALQAKAAKGRENSLVLINLRRVNMINSLYGYSFCESRLRTVAERLRDQISGISGLFQVSYGRFALYIIESMNKEQLEDLCNSIIKTLKEIPIIDTFGCGIGVRLFEAGSDLAENVIQNAATAAERADNSKPFAYRFFDEELAAEIKRHSEIEELLQSTAHFGGDNKLFLEYQPIINPVSGKTQGFEALARLDGGKLGIISPNEFIPIAEENQLIVPIGMKIAKMACDFLARMEDQGFRGVMISINVSALQLAQDEFVDELFATIHNAGVNPKQVCLEVTESVFAQNYAAINEKFTAFRQAGLSIAIDDFGTGYSSLAMERDLNVNCIKIDKAFIDRLAALGDEQVITGDIISMAHRLGHYVVAEGVELEKQKDYLIRHGCDLVQGYLFSRPLSEINALVFLRNQS